MSFVKYQFHLKKVFLHRISSFPRACFVEIRFTHLFLDFVHFNPYVFFYFGITVWKVITYCPREMQMQRVFSGWVKTWRVLSVYRDLRTKLFHWLWTINGDTALLLSFSAFNKQAEVKFPNQIPSGESASVLSKYNLSINGTVSWRNFPLDCQFWHSSNECPEKR